MGGIFASATSGFPAVQTTDRLKASNAGAGQSGNRVFMVGQDAGQNSTINDFIVIGNAAGDAGILDADLDGTIIVGARAASALTVSTSTTPISGSNIIIGQDAAVVAPNISTSVIIGNRALLAAVGTVSNNQGISSCVVIGYEAASTNIMDGPNGEIFSDSVIIGFRAAKGPLAGTPKYSLTQTVVIGSRAAELSGGDDASGRNLINSVIIGYQAGRQCASAGSTANLNTLIGHTAAATLTSGDTNTVVGGANLMSGAAARNTCLGASCDPNGGNDNTVVGSNTTITGILSRCVLFGAGVGTSGSDAVTANDSLLIGTGLTGARKTAFFGDLANGNMIIGNVTAANRPFRGTTPPTNAVRLINGTVGAGTNPAEGGYFYVLAGILHWYDQSGVDSVLGVPTAGQMTSSVTGYTNNAAAAAATILNGPTAGNPTKWIPINDNGTIRNIPAW